MSGSRLETLRSMLKQRPDDPRLLFAVALEYLNAGELDDGVAYLRQYLDVADDEGNAWGRLGAALRESRRYAEAREAYEAGIEAAERHGHPSMAEEFREVLDDWS